MRTAFKSFFNHIKTHHTKLFIGCFISSAWLYHYNSEPKMVAFNDSSKPTHYTKLSEEELKKFTNKHPSLSIFNQNKTVEYLMSFLRDKTLSCPQFRYYADRVIRVLLESVIAKEYLKIVIKESPLGTYEALETEVPLDNFCAVTILRAGNSFMNELLYLFPGISLGQILIQRNEESKEKEPIFYFSKLPKDIQNMKVLLCDPMVGTGGSLCCALQNLKEKGVKEENVIIVSLIGCYQGVEKIYGSFPKVKMILGFLDEKMIPNTKYIAPGLGDFGDRYYGTT